MRGRPGSRIAASGLRGTICWLLLGGILFGQDVIPTPVETEPQSIEAQSVVISLIDDASPAFGEAGVVRRVHVRPGAIVRAGELLAELDLQDVELQLQRMQTELEMSRLKAENDLSLQLAGKAWSVANAELSRAERSNERFKDAVSATEIDRLRLARDQAELQTEQARHDQRHQRLMVELKEVEVALAQRQIERRKLTAPSAGVIVAVKLQQGEWAQPDQAFCRILNTDRVSAEGLVSASDVTLVVGQPVRILHRQRDANELELQGEITFVDPEIDTITGQYRVWAEIANPDQVLRPGHRPRMMIDPLPGLKSAE